MSWVGKRGAIVGLAAVLIAGCGTGVGDAAQSKTTTTTRCAR
ncbi:MAG: hypothetical protein WAW08_08680 [Candidatus Microthrix parvicella]|nr:hypothetical protein [Candidatus Microthrix sp.]